MFTSRKMIRYDPGPDKICFCSMYKSESLFIQFFIVGGAYYEYSCRIGLN